MSAVDQAWQLVQSLGAIDSERLFRAVTDEETLSDPSVRTQLLVRDALRGLRSFWGEPTFTRRVSQMRENRRILAAIDTHQDEEGFLTLGRRIMEVTDPNVLHKLFRELSRRVDQPCVVTIGGSLALMLNDYISRVTDDVDIVDELPAAIRTQYSLLEDLARRYNLRLAHFQSHYLPQRWERRTWSLGVYDQLTVRVIDSLDVLAGKSFSSRKKDMDDLVASWSKLDVAAFRERLARDTDNFRSDAKSLEAAKHNWYVLTGEQELP